MALNNSGRTQPGNSIRIVGSNETEVAQDSGGRLENVMLGDDGSVIAQDPATGQLLAQMLGSQGNAVAQDGNNRLENVLLGNENIVVDQDPSSGQLLARFVGNQGSEIDQDTDGKQTFRTASAANADVDITDSNGNSYDLDAQGDFTRTDLDIGGSAVLNISVDSQDDALFKVSVTWQDDNSNDLSTETASLYPGLRGTSVRTSIPVYGDKYDLTITDISGGQNRVVGSINANMGTSTAVRTLSRKGTNVDVNSSTRSEQFTVPQTADYIVCNVDDAAGAFHVEVEFQDENGNAITVRDDTDNSSYSGDSSTDVFTATEVVGAFAEVRIVDDSGASNTIDYSIYSR